MDVEICNHVKPLCYYNLIHESCLLMCTGPDPAATMSSKRAKGKTTKKRPQRATSNVFAMFDQSQIQEFKEAFNMIDQNRDGFIDKEDLHDMLASLGTQPSSHYTVCGATSPIFVYNVYLSWKALVNLWIAEDWEERVLRLLKYALIFPFGFTQKKRNWYSFPC